MSDHIPDLTKMIGDTPRTDEQINGKPCTRFAILAGDSLRNAVVQSEFARQLERELNAANERIKRLEDALAAYQKAYTPDGHIKPHDCFATGPRTGDPIQDLVVCPGCWAEQKAKEAKP